MAVPQVSSQHAVREADVVVQGGDRLVADNPHNIQHRESDRMRLKVL